MMDLAALLELPVFHRIRVFVVQFLHPLLHSTEN